MQGTSERAELVAEGEEVVRRVVRRMHRRLAGVIPTEDLESMGRVALAEALRDYDPARGSFGTFVGALARWAMLTGIRKELHGREVAARASILTDLDRATEAHAANDTEPEPMTEAAQAASLSAMLEGQAAALAVGLVARRSDAGLSTPVATPEEHLLRAEADRRLADAVEGLPDRERELVRRHYFGGEPFEGIARDLGISKSWASRLHAQAIASLGKALTPTR